MPEALTFHALRHVAVTAMADAGVPYNVTQRRAGHSTARMTMERYSHRSTDPDKDAAAALQERRRQGTGTWHGTDTTVVPTAVVVVVQAEPGTVTVGTVEGVVGTVTTGIVTVGRVGSAGTLRFDGGLPPEPFVLPELPDPDDRAPGADPVDGCWPGDVDAVPCVDPDPVCASVPGAGVPGAVVVVKTGCEACAERNGTVSAYAPAAAPPRASVAAAKVPARRTRVRAHAGRRRGACSITSRSVVRTSAAK